jgi:hypothetical protein
MHRTSRTSKAQHASKFCTFCTVELRSNSDLTAAFVDAQGNHMSDVSTNNNVLVCSSGQLVSWGNDFVREKNLHDKNLADLLQLPASDLHVR